MNGVPQFNNQHVPEAGAPTNNMPVDSAMAFKQNIQHNQQHFQQHDQHHAQQLHHQHMVGQNHLTRTVRNEVASHPSSERLVTGPSTVVAPSSSGSQVNGSLTDSHTNPAFPFHNPFDTQSYPLTNPPIFDYTMKFSYTGNDGAPRRRRISISNGQIGQIVSHEFINDDDSTPEGEELNGYQYQNQQGHLEVPPRTVPLSQNQIQSQIMSETQIQNQNQAQIQPLPTKIDDVEYNAAGVPPPNHQLIYDNEVIYNPNDGPIPGTAAWKKERLLERNRIAASRCRQRKKQAQQVLHENVSKYQVENKLLLDKVDKYREILKRYNEAIMKHASECKNFESLSLLRMLEEMDLDDEEKENIKV